MNKATLPVTFSAGSHFIFRTKFDSEKFKELCTKWAGKKGMITIDCSKKKSNKQNDYFRGPLLDEIFKALRDMGHEDIVTKVNAFWWVKNRFFLKNFKMIDGYPHVEHFSTDNKTWKTIDWENKMEQIRIFFNDLGYILPLPKEPNEKEI